MNIDLTILTDAVARDRASSIGSVRMRNARINQLPDNEIDHAQRALLEDFRGLYARRCLVHNPKCQFLFQSWRIGFGDNFTRAVKVSNDYLLDEDAEHIAELIAEKWNEQFDLYIERDY
ncbi:hypothetical protein [Roseibium sp. MMSF_3361]|nr:hypothetical protein [Roseibium sp. MMSF_3361]